MSALAMQRYYGAVGAEPASVAPSGNIGDFVFSDFLKADGTPVAAFRGRTNSLVDVDKYLAEAMNAGAVSGDISTAGGVLIRRLQGRVVMVNEDFPVGGRLLARLLANKKALAGVAVGVAGVLFLALK